jgi:hypothetical protein
VKTLSSLGFKLRIEDSRVDRSIMAIHSFPWTGGP